MSFGEPMGLRIAIDTGGTFTDVVAIDEATGESIAVKTPSTPLDPSIGLLDGVEKAFQAMRRPPEDLRILLHGSTVATNASPASVLLSPAASAT
jgi:N-methylhydantoinase A